MSKKGAAQPDELDEFVLLPRFVGMSCSFVLSSSTTKHLKMPSSPSCIKKNNPFITTLLLHKQNIKKKFGNCVSIINSTQKTVQLNKGNVLLSDNVA